MTRTVATSLSAAGALLALVLLPAPAFAGQVVAIGLEKGSYQTQQPFAGDAFPAAPHGPVIRVESIDGESYHHVQLNNSFDFHLWVKSACTPTSLDSKVRVKVGNHEETIVSGWGGSLFSSLIDGEDIELETPYQQPAMPGGPVAACNDWLAQNYPSPATRWEPLQKGFALRIDNAFQARIQVTCGAVIKDTESKTVNVPVWIRCLGTPLAQPPAPPPTIPGASLKRNPGPPIPPGPGNLAVAFAVTAVSAQIQPAKVTVPHPSTQAQLTAKAQVTTNGDGEVEHRWVHNGGAGPVATLSFAAAGTKTVTLPLAVQCQQQQPGLTTTTPAAGGIGGLAQAPANVKNGFVRLEILSPAGNVKKSSDVAYSVTCAPAPPPSSPVAGGGLAAQPAAPQLPDLRIRTARVDRRQPTKVEAQVVNSGTGAAAATRLKLWVTPGGKAWYAVIPPLAAGQSAWVTVAANVPVLDAAHVYLRADDPPKVSESDEGNNGHQVK